MRIVTKTVLAILFCATVLAHAADDALSVALKTADDERVAATISGDRARLNAIFSDELHYAHSTGAVDTKVSYTDAIASGKLKYTNYDYSERAFTFPAPGIALLVGRAHIVANTPNGISDGVLSFLAVWREEKGQWHFLAWQSCKLPIPAAATPAK